MTDSKSLFEMAEELGRLLEENERTRQQIPVLLPYFWGRTEHENCTETKELTVRKKR